jgi:hypothetical protein
MQAVSVAAPSLPSHIHYGKVMVQAEISLLWALADVFPSSKTAAGDHREAIEAQLCVLVDELDLSQVLVEFDSESTGGYVRQAAIQATVWLAQGGEPPSTGWLRLSDRSVRPPQDFSRDANQVA